MNWGPFGKSRTQRAYDDALAKNAAIMKSQAVIEFELDGTILTANEIFLATMGYELDEIVGQHHAMFVEPAYAASQDYQEFWASLANGEFRSDEFRRLGKDGREVWIQATYTPLLDKTGIPYKVVKFATDVTAQKLKFADLTGQVAAIGMFQAIIEFTPTGEIITANQKFLDVTGFRLDQLQGRHHSMLVPRERAQSAEYQEFWDMLAKGHRQTAVYQRDGENGRKVWIQATYNPIPDVDGKPVKIVTYTTNITSQKRVVEDLKVGLEKLAANELDAEITEAFDSDFEDVRIAFNSTVAQFSNVISRLRDTSSSLKIATGEILAGSNDLSERTSRQAATIEETSAAIQQLAATVVETAKRAEEASQGSVLASKTVVESGEVMGRANGAMERITSSSSKISNIIGLIDDIAFQTNLLALNASVEAARAGEAGKGFAVVAIEVRRLAQSAAEASSEVKALIEQSATEVDSGTRLVSEANGKIAALLETVQKNAELMSDIASENKLQASAIDEVNSSVKQMDEMTQHNAALVEQTNAAIEQTEEQANELDRIVDAFAMHADHAKSSGSPAGGFDQQRHQVSRGKLAEAPAFHGNTALDEDWSEF